MIPVLNKEPPTLGSAQLGLSDPGTTGERCSILPLSGMAVFSSIIVIGFGVHIEKAMQQPIREMATNTKPAHDLQFSQLAKPRSGRKNGHHKRENMEIPSLRIRVKWSLSMNHTHTTWLFRKRHWVKSETHNFTAWAAAGGVPPRSFCKLLCKETNYMQIS